jgi:hypothetical protein
MAQVAAKDADEGDANSEAEVLSKSQPVCILCLPARDEADEIAGMMLAQLLATDECDVQSISFATAASELLGIVEQYHPEAICISATPPAAVMHARHMCAQLRGRIPEVSLVVGLWNAQYDLSKAKKRIGDAARTQVVATLAEAQAQVRLLIQPRSPPSQQDVLEGKAESASTTLPAKSVRETVNVARHAIRNGF